MARIWNWALCLTLLSVLPGLAQQVDLDSLLNYPSPTSRKKQLQIAELVEQNPSLLQTSVKRHQKRGRLPLLIYALDKGDLPLSRLLLKLGSNPNTQAGRGQKPALHWIISSDANQETKFSLIQLLLSSRVNTEQVDRAGRNVFHALAENGVWKDERAFLSVSKNIMASGSTLKATDNRGLSPLMTAVMRHDAHMATQLIRLGADPLKRSEILGLNAVTLAEQQSHTIDHPKEAAEVLQVLQKSVQSSETKTWF